MAFFETGTATSRFCQQTLDGGHSNSRTTGKTSLDANAPAWASSTTMEYR
jgi:hypothetical protein